MTKMKFLNKCLLITLICGFMACEDIETVNIDPNAAPSALPESLLNATQDYMGWIVDSRLNGQSFLWGQYWTWGPGVSLGNAARYVAEPDDHNNYWFRSYANALTDLKEIEKADIPGYSGVSKILSAYIYQGLVDHFGDIPFSEALSGAIEDGSNFNPKYDDAKSVYEGLIAMVDDGLADLSVGENILGDKVFDGDISKWTQFGNSLKLRLLMRQSVTGDQASIGNAVREVISNGNFLTEGAAELNYSGDSGNQNPMFADEESGIGLFYVMSDASYKLLSDLQDPRLAVLYSPREDAIVGPIAAPSDADNVAPTDAAGFRAVAQGAINELGFGTVREEFSQPGEAIYSATASTVFMSSWEVFFLRAEAAARYGTADDEAAMFNNAISANFAFLGLGDASDGYLSGLSYDSGAALDQRLRIIGTQKWISCNGIQEDEGWIESRRFDREGDRMFSGQGGIFQSPTENSLGNGNYPSSWLYPADEQSLNTNSPNQRVITEKVFWDN